MQVLWFAYRRACPALPYVQELSEQRPLPLLPLANTHRFINLLRVQVESEGVEELASLRGRHCSASYSSGHRHNLFLCQCGGGYAFPDLEG